MANRFSFFYGPGGSGGGAEGASGAPPPTEIVISEDRIDDTITTILRAIEFLRLGYCGGRDADAMTVPNSYVSGIASDNSVEVRAASNARFGAASPAAQYAPSSVALHTPVTTAPNRTLETARHAALTSIRHLPFTSVPRSFQGVKATATAEPTCAPFVLRVTLSKPANAVGFFSKRPETFEEWEFAFVKVRNSHRTPPNASFSDSPVGQDGASSPNIRSGGAGGASLVQQHALGLAPRGQSVNDPAKLRDVLHFINRKALVPMDFVVEELRVLPEVQFDVSLAPNDRGTAFCVLHPSAPALVSAAAAAQVPAARGATGAAAAALRSSVPSFWFFGGSKAAGS